MAAQSNPLPTLQEHPTAPPFPRITPRILPKSLLTATEQGMELGPRLLGSLQANEREHICWLLTVGLFGNVLIKHFSQKIPTRRE